MLVYLLGIHLACASIQTPGVAYSYKGPIGLISDRSPRQSQTRIRLRRCVDALDLFPAVPRLACLSPPGIFSFFLPLHSPRLSRVCVPNFFLSLCSFAFVDIAETALVMPVSPQSSSFLPFLDFFSLLCLIFFCFSLLFTRHPSTAGRGIDVVCPLASTTWGIWLIVSRSTQGCPAYGARSSYLYCPQ